MILRSRLLLLRLRRYGFHFYSVRFRDVFILGGSLFRFGHGLLFLGFVVFDWLVRLFFGWGKFRRRPLRDLDRRDISIGLFFFRGDLVLLLFRRIGFRDRLVGRR